VRAVNRHPPVREAFGPKTLSKPLPRAPIELRFHARHLVGRAGRAGHPVAAGAERAELRRDFGGRDRAVVFGFKSA
jgi:hypothetical protein